MREMLTPAATYPNQHARQMRPRLPDGWGTPLFQTHELSDDRLPPEHEPSPESGCDGMWEIFPGTGQVVLSTAAMSIWRSTRHRLALTELLARVHVQDRKRITTALADCDVVRGADFQFRLMADRRERTIWTYFSAFVSDRDILRGWCVDLTRHL